MEANELRLGNFIQIKGKPECITTVDSLDGRISHGGDSVDDMSPDYYEGIPLTEEWLRKLGFDDKDYKKGWIGINVKFTDFVLSKPNTEVVHSDHYCYNYECGRLVLYNEFKYVHKLQNFFYALTGEELNTI